MSNVIYLNQYIKKDNQLKSNSFDEKLTRVRNSLDRINSTMAELRAMETKKPNNTIQDFNGNDSPFCTQKKCNEGTPK